MSGVTLTTLPLSRLPSSMASKLPTPLWPTSDAANRAGMYLSSSASDVPPGLNPQNWTSSFLNSVGLSITLTPFASFHSVSSRSGVLISAVNGDATGGLAIRGSCDTLSSYAVTVLALASRTAATSSASVGTTRPSFSGAFTTTTLLCSDVQASATLFTSSRVASGSAASRGRR